MACIYNPDMMHYDNATSYYSKTYTSTGNKVTHVFRFKHGTYTGNTKYIIDCHGATNNRLSVVLVQSDPAEPTAANKILVLARNSADTIILQLVSITEFADDGYHTGFVSFDADLGVATFVIDGNPEDDLTSPIRIAPTTGTLNQGASSEFVVGAKVNPDRYWDGDIGYLGSTEQYLTNWSDFMDGNQPKRLDEVTWTEWNGRPLFWNAVGEMDRNGGSEGPMTVNGTLVRVSVPPPDEQRIRIYHALDTQLREQIALYLNEIQTTMCSNIDRLDAPACGDG
jgi:hypothetical protein